MPHRFPRSRTAAAVALCVAVVVTLGASGGATRAAVDAPVPDEPHAYDLARARQVVEKRVIGHSVEGRPIVAWRKGNPDAARTVLVLGQMHGDERAGTVTARHIRTKLPVDSDADVWIIETMNPDGLAAGTRRNARGVDLNRNWPTNGWVRTSPSSITYGGPRRASEPETRAMRAFLREVQPDWITSIHQPFGTVGRNGKTPLFIDRLVRNLGLPRDDISVGTPDDRVAPTLASWYNAGFEGGAVTVEFTRAPTDHFKTRVAGPGILAASLADW